MNKNKAFTLIELLVVIAIIGILSSVVLASLNTARTKGKDAALMADMDAITKQAALYQDNNGNSFGISANDCTAAVFSDPQILSALAAIDVVNGGGTKECDANDSTYAIAAARPTGSNYTPATVYWCADSTGRKCGIDDLAALSSTGECGCP